MARLSRVTDATASPERQVAACRELCATRGYDVVGVPRIWTSVLARQHLFDRPQLGRWLQGPSQFDVIVCSSAWIASYGNDYTDELGEIDELLPDLTDQLGASMFKRGIPQRDRLDARIQSLTTRQAELSSTSSEPAGWRYEPTGELFGNGGKLRTRRPATLAAADELSRRVEIPNRGQPNHSR